MMGDSGGGERLAVILEQPKRVVYFATSKGNADSRKDFGTLEFLFPIIGRLKHSKGDLRVALGF